MGQHDHRSEAPPVERLDGGEKVGVGATELGGGVHVEDGGGHQSRTLTTRAGLPRAMARGGTSRVTTEPAPTIAPGPMVTPSRTITPLPSQQSSPTEMPRRRTPCSL